MTLDFLLTPVIDARFEPGHRFVNWLILQFPGHEWAAAVAIGAFCVGAATVGVAVNARAIAGSSVAALATGAIFGTWVGWSRIALWWANSAQTLPAIALSAWAIWAAIRWDRNGRRHRDLWLAGLLLAAAFCFSVRSAIVLPIAAVLLAIATPSTEGISTREIGARLRRTWPLLAVLGAVTLVFVVTELSSNNALENPLPTPAIETWVSFSAQWTTKGLGAISSNRWLPAGTEAGTGVWLGLAMLFVAAALTIRGSRSVAIWAATVLLVLACGIQVAVYRLAQLGLLINEDLRYHEGDVLVLATLVPAAWAASGKPWPKPGWARVTGIAAVAAFALLWTSGWAVSIRALKANTSPLADLRQGPIARATVETLRGSLDGQLNDTDPEPPSIITDRTPAGLSPYVDRNLPGVLEVFAPETRGRVTFLSTRGVPITVDDQGFARRVQITDPSPLGGSRRTCLSTTPKSELAGPGAAGFKLDVPRGYGERGPTVVDLPLAKTRSPGRLAISFLPSETGLPDVETVVSRKRPGIRLLVPAGALALNISAWGGLATCIEDPAIWEMEGDR